MRRHVSHFSIWALLRRYLRSAARRQIPSSQHVFLSVNIVVPIQPRKAVDLAVSRNRAAVGDRHVRRGGRPSSPVERRRSRRYRYRRGTFLDRPDAETNIGTRRREPIRPVPARARPSSPVALDHRGQRDHARPVGFSDQGTDASRVGAICRPVAGIAPHAGSFRYRFSQGQGPDPRSRPTNRERRSHPGAAAPTP